MKKIFLVGKFNSIMQRLNRVLGKRFRIQLCSDNPEMVKGMIQMTPPDLVLISTMGMTVEHHEIFAYLESNCSDIPVICIGTTDELKLFSDIISNEQFSNMTRHIQMVEILKVIQKRLHVEGEFEALYAEAEKPEQKKILLIDDSPIQLRTMKNILQSKYEVEMAVSAAEALKAIKRNVPDLIFLDYDMPDCDGRQTLTQIRENEISKDIPVIFLTGVNDRERIQAVLSLNPAGYMLKPVEQKKIVSILEEILGD